MSAIARHGATAAAREIPSGRGGRGGRPDRPGRAPGALLAAGIAAGPVFGVTSAAQVLTRDGFDLSRQPLSLLSLGDLGWIQITNFVVSGLLVVAAAVGLRRALRGGRAATWGPRLVAAYGMGLVAAGVFRADPSVGFPPGAPEGMPDPLSWHGILHGVAATVAFLALCTAFAVFARRDAELGRRGWAAAGGVIAVVTFVLSAWPDPDTASVRLAIGATLAFGWLATLSVRMFNEPPEPAEHPGPAAQPNR